MKDRIPFYDILRISAAIAVIILHVASSKWYTTDVNSFEWRCFTIYDSLVRWAVPVFVMISGGLFLRIEMSLHHLYKKYIFRILKALLFWSIIYSIPSIINGSSLISVISDMIKKPGHLWFLYMIVGLYLIVPFLQKIVESTKLTNYYLLLAFIFAFIIPETIALTAFINAPISDLLSSLISQMKLFFPLGYSFYFVLGYCLTQNQPTKKQRAVIYILSIIGLFMTIALTCVASYLQGRPVEHFFDFMTINVMLESIGVFVLIKEVFLKRPIPQKKISLLSHLSNYCFGIYLSHMLILKLFNAIGLTTLAFNAVLAVPLISLLVLLLSTAFSFLVHKIPILNKYIV